jgi:hypothetical protein
MPVIAVNLSQKTYSDIMSLVGQGAYSGPEQFLEIAAFNQLALERGLTPEELLKGIQRPAAVQTTGRETAPISTRKKSSPPSAEVHKVMQAPATARVAADVDGPELQDVLSRFSLHAATSLRLKPSASNAGSANDRVWGQVNRLFPLKAACRWIAVAAGTHGRWPDMALAVSKLASDAAVIGSALEKADIDGSRKREEMMGVGLPRKGNLQSSDRFLSQFVARVTRANRVFPGAIVQYGLATVDVDALQLSKSGIELANMENPVLDGDLAKSNRTLSEDERIFLRRQIWEFVPAEKQDFGVVLKAILDGNKKPESLMSATRSDFPANWTEMAVRTHLYGVLARLGELGLVSKHWEGRSVEYNVPDAALDLLSVQPAGALK